MIEVHEKYGGIVISGVKIEKKKILIDTESRILSTLRETFRKSNQ